jgi:hypothetical protein
MAKGHGTEKQHGKGTKKIFHLVNNKI